MAKKRSAIPVNKQHAIKKIALPKIGTPTFRGTPEGKSTVLHIGIFAATAQTLHKSFHTDAWHVVRLDTRTDMNPDFIGSMTDMSMFPDQSVHAIWCPQVMQKLFDHDIKKALREAYRVLKDEGTFYMTVPDGQIAGAYLAHNRLHEALYSSPAGDITSLDLLFGFQAGIKAGNHSLIHHCIFTTESLIAYMRESGFTNIQIKRERFELQVVARRFADNDERRVERTTITQSNKLFEGENVPIVPPIPAQHVTPTGYRSSPNMMVDELDQPPKEWQPLNLPR